jgi:hypothetical protein
MRAQLHAVSWSFYEIKVQIRLKSLINKSIQFKRKMAIKKKRNKPEGNEVTEEP